MLEIDNSGNFISHDESDTEFNEKAQQVLKEKHSDVMLFLKMAKDCWGLEPIHDFETGIKSILNGMPIITFSVMALLFGIFCLIISALIWILRCRIPFNNQFSAEMDNVYGMAEFNFKRNIGDYEFYASCPQFFRNNGFLMVQKHRFSTDRISLIIYPNKKATQYFALVNPSEIPVRKASKFKMEYLQGKVFSSQELVSEHREEIEDLIVQANLFWQI